MQCGHVAWFVHGILVESSGHRRRALLSLFPSFWLAWHCVPVYEDGDCDRSEKPHWRWETGTSCMHAAERARALIEGKA